MLQWQGYLGAGDLVQGKRDAVRRCAPLKDAHRGRIKVGIAKDEGEKPIGPSITLILIPTKNDRMSEKKLSRLFVIDEDESSISSARAVGE